MKVIHSVLTIRTLVFALVLVFVLLRAGAIADRLSLSWLLSTILREEWQGNSDKRPVQIFLDMTVARSSVCPLAISKIDSEGRSGMVDASQRRLMRYVSLACESDEQIINRFENELAQGYRSTAMDALYVGEALARSGDVDRAMTLRQTEPVTGLWYVHLGRLAIEQAHDEAQALDYFRLADAISPNFAVEKESMYMYLCLASIRDNRSDVLDQPCVDFDRITQTSASRLYLGRSYYNQKDFTQALRYLTDSINLGDSSGDAYFWKGRTLEALGNTTEAEHVYKAGVIQASTYPWNYLGLAELETGKGCYATAREYFNSVQTLNIPEATSAALKALQAIDPRRGDNPGCP